MQLRRQDGNVFDIGETKAWCFLTVAVSMCSSSHFEVDVLLCLRKEELWVDVLF